MVECGDPVECGDAVESGKIITCSNCSVSVKRD